MFFKKNVYLFKRTIQQLCYKQVLLKMMQHFYAKYHKKGSPNRSLITKIENNSLKILRYWHSNAKYSSTKKTYFLLATFFFARFYPFLSKGTRYQMFHSWIFTIDDKTLKATASFCAESFFSDYKCACWHTLIHTMRFDVVLPNAIKWTVKCVSWYENTKSTSKVQVFLSTFLSEVW